MARLFDNPDGPTRGISLTQVNRDGFWEWLLERPSGDGLCAEYIDDFGHLLEAIWRTHRAAEMFERQLRDQRRGDQARDDD